MDNLCVGKPDTTPSKPAHTTGVREGNEPGGFAKEPGHLPNGRATARRSTGINPGKRNPIDSRMPNLPPA
ncbi:MAG TPA: hypothetical protein VK066_25005 [Chloroflexota bacterium]|nr:hypothetical protein [Chloroflexota bacterium]